MGKNQDLLDKTVLLDNLSKIQYTVNKTYFSRLQKDYTVLPFEKYNQGENKLDYSSDVRALKIDRFVYNTSENSADCFQNVLSLYSGTSDAIAFVFKRTFEGTEIYVVLRSDLAGDGEHSTDGIKALQESFFGNFAGCHTEIIGLDESDFLDSDQIESSLWNGIDIKSVAATCNIPSAKSEKYLSQGIEKVLNGIMPSDEHEGYIIIVLAESLNNQEVDTITSGYEEMSTSIHPFISHQFQMGESKANTTGEMSSVSETESTSAAITKTHSVNVGVNGSRSSSVSAGLSYIVNIGASKGKSAGITAGYGYSRSKTEQKGHARTETFGTQKSVTLGTSESTTYSYQSYEIKNLQHRLEMQAERLKKGKALGMWRYATFVCAENAIVSKNVANALRSITQGETSYIEPSVIQEWSYAEINGVSPFDEIKEYVKYFSHPVFTNIEDGTPVHYSSYINTAELVNAIAFPHSSVLGLPVISCAPFGMEPHSLDRIQNDVEIGYAYHMYEKNKKRRIFLDKKELTKHTFIAGSTGSGKSNTVYYLIDSLIKDSSIKFMVIEPAKGEYKDVFGQRQDVHIYGTNPNVSDVLRVNPFAFPEKVHVLEHVDRLTEIFNVCWPMYAAMPAILKDSIERAYVSCGWDLTRSENRYGKGDNRIFPSFEDVLSEIKSVLDESEYSDENKGDYVGSLSTRVRSLTSGINGIIFGGDYIEDDKLFEENVIVDLSRVGSTETKSLIMGILILKLQEFRAGTEAKVSDELNHITVLEEAHNILKRTSFEQSSESSNLIGKSVEMISNSIAEMRTYGEGFIIVDQAPQLLDMSAIRNTNTKIILRLPDYGDRELVGRAIGLNESQLNEMARFKQGVAVVSQSGWIEPVLCAIHEYTEYDKDKKYICPISVKNDDTTPVILKMIMTKEITHFSQKSIEDQQKFVKQIIKSNLKGSVKATLLDCLKKTEDIEQLQKLIYEFFDSKECLRKAECITDVSDWTHFVVSTIVPSIAEYPANQIDAVIALILAEHVTRDLSYKGFVTQYAMYLKENGGVY